MTDTSFLTDLAAAWKARDYPHASPASSVEIQAFESAHHVNLPPDLRAYFQQLNGGDLGRDGSMDDEAISFWRLDQVELLDDEKVGRSRVFAFGDFLIDSHRYAIQLSANPTDPTPVFIDWGSWRDNDPTLDKVASSFTEFIRGYTAKDYAVIYGVPRPAA